MAAELNDQILAWGLEPQRFLNRRWTYDELLGAMPESNASIELWNGELQMSPSRYQNRCHTWPRLQ